MQAGCGSSAQNIPGCSPCLRLLQVWLLQARRQWLLLRGAEQHVLQSGA